MTRRGAVAAMPQDLRLDRSRGAITSARDDVGPGPITTTTRQIAAARRRDAEERAERTRLEVLVDRLDAVIEACEQAHLADLAEAPAGLAAQARAAMVAATPVLTTAGEDAAGGIASRARAGVPITELMDAVWEVQDGVLDVLIPERWELDEGRDDGGRTATDDEWPAMNRALDERVTSTGAELRQEEAIDDTALTPGLADEVALPSEEAMAAQDASQAQASTAAEMAAEPTRMQPAGGMQPA
jgi:hypothetical protein